MPSADSAEQATPALHVRAGYLGWTGFSNMGDDAIFLAVRDVLQGVHLDPVPIGMRRTASTVVRGDHRRWSATHLVLGGGTVLGRRIWRAHLGGALRICRASPAVMLGAGVEDGSFVRDHWLSERGELRHWRRLLARFDRVTVRGPRSADLLAGIGVEASVVGDPALLIGEGPATGPPTGWIGVNLGCGDDLWGHDQRAVVETVAVALHGLCKRRVRFLVVNPADRDDHLRCAAAARLPRSSFEIVDARDPMIYLTAARQCDLLLVQRLHAAVVGASVGVPVVMLEYQPKCADFMASISASDRSIRTDRLQPAPLIEVVTAVDEQLSMVASEQSARVIDLRQRLISAAAELRRVIGATAIPG